MERKVTLNLDADTHEKLAQLADALGISCILVPWGHNDDMRLAATGRNVAKSCDELICMLDNMR